MKKYTIILFKIVLLLITIAVFSLSVIGIISLIQDPINPIYGYILYPIVIAIYLSTVLIYMAFYQTNKFLSLIEKQWIFSNTSIRFLEKIKWYGLIFGILYLIALPFFYLLANADDAPGVIFVGMIPLVGGVIVFLFAEIMIKIIDEGIELK